MPGRRLLVIAGMLGAGCTHVARIISEKLNIPFVNSEKILREIVIEKGISYSQFAELVSSGEVDIEKLVRSELLDYVNEGNVIIEGRSGLMVLDREADIKVFLWAPEEYRARMVAQRRRISLDEALDHVRISDEERRDLVKRLFKKDWLDLNLYDLVINTGKWSYEETADLVISAYEMKLRNRR